jgi:predicted phage-related endonuclease
MRALLKNLRPATKTERHPIVDRASWLTMRLQDVTASDVAAVCNADPRRSALAVYVEKIGLLPPKGDDPIMQRGRWFEAAFPAALADERQAWKVLAPKIYLRDPELRLGATPDLIAEDARRYGELGNVQCKVVSRPVFERDWEDGLPLWIELQTLTEMLLLNAVWGAVAALVVDTYSAELRLFPVERHAAAEARIAEAVQTFWADVAAGRQPPVRAPEDAEAIAALHPRDCGTVLDLAGDNELPGFLDERQRLKAEIGEREERVAVVDGAIKAKLGNAAEAALPGWKISYRTQRRAERVLPAWEGRVLRVTDRREKKGRAA